jgi:hypothetical protein
MHNIAARRKNAAFRCKNQHFHARIIGCVLKAAGQFLVGVIVDDVTFFRLAECDAQNAAVEPRPDI